MPSPITIAEFPHEFTATLAKHALEAAGIPCQLVGIHTAGFRAEAPGMVKLLVPAAREAEARAIIDDFNAPPDDPDDPDEPGGPGDPDDPDDPPSDP